MYGRKLWSVVVVACGREEGGSFGGGSFGGCDADLEICNLRANIEGQREFLQKKACIESV